MQVFQEGVAEEVRVLRPADDRRDGRQARELRSAESALPHDQLEATVVQRAHDDRLQQAYLGDRRHQLGQQVLVEDRARLLGVGPDQIDRHFGEACASRGFGRRVARNVRGELGIRALQEVAKPAAQSGALLRGIHADLSWVVSMAAPRAAISVAASRYAWAPAEAEWYVITDCP